MTVDLRSLNRVTAIIHGGRVRNVKAYDVARLSEFEAGGSEQVYVIFQFGNNDLWMYPEHNLPPMRLEPA